MSDKNEQLTEHWRQRCEELQAKIERLQTLQPAGITPKELEAVNDELPERMIGRHTIAAVCRGMTREVGGDG